MKRFFLIFSIPILIFCTLICLCLIKSNELDLFSKSLNGDQKELFQLRADLNSEMLLSSDLKIAQSEWEHWSEQGKRNIIFWNEFLNKPNNLHTTHSSKSSSAISTDINKLLSSLNRSCKGKNVKFDIQNQLENSFLTTPDQVVESFGFGFK